MDFKKTCGKSKTGNSIIIMAKTTDKVGQSSEMPQQSQNFSLVNLGSIYRRPYGRELRTDHIDQSEES